MINNKATSLLTIKERPIIFSDPMVRAILDGKKTQTRRTRGLNEINKNPDGWIPSIHTDMDGVLYVLFEAKGGVDIRVNCPYGRPENRLWVRHSHWRGKEGVNDQVWDEFTMTTRWPGGRTIQDHKIGLDNEGKHSLLKKKSPIYMPRWASLISLNITDIRMERLQNISETDAIAEGVELRGITGSGYKNYLFVNAVLSMGARLSFASLWESIKGEGAWDKNPWVFALTFERKT